MLGGGYSPPPHQRGPCIVGVRQWQLPFLRHFQNLYCILNFPALYTSLFCVKKTITHARTTDTNETTDETKILK